MKGAVRWTIIFFRKVIAFYRVLKKIPEAKAIADLPCYYPGKPRKKRKYRIRDNIKWLLKYGEVNSFYTIYGLDLKNSVKPSAYMDYIHFMHQRNEKNHMGDVMSQLVLLRDKYMFYKYMSAVGLPVAEVFAVALILACRVGIHPHVGRQIGMRVLHGLIQHGNNDRLVSLTLLPCVIEIDVGTLHGDSDRPAVIMVMPLFGKKRVVHRQRRAAGCRAGGGGCGMGTHGKMPAQLRPVRIFEDLHPVVFAQRTDHLLQRHGLVERDHIPLVQSECAVTLLEAGIGAEQRRNPIDPFCGEQFIDGDEFRARRRRGQRGGKGIGRRCPELDDQLSLDGALGREKDLHGRRGSLRVGIRHFRILHASGQHEQTQQQQIIFLHKRVL